MNNIEFKSPNKNHPVPYLKHGVFYIYKAESEKYPEMVEIVKDKLDSLTPREAQILRMRFGFDGGIGHTLEEIADIFEVTRETIRQIEARALRHMRHPTRSDDLKQFVEE